jgi:hypothetical protein
MSCLATLIVAAAGVAPTSAQGACVNQQEREASAYSPMLPDCRAFEQVSPVDKNVAALEGDTEVVRGAPSGDAVTFDALGSFPASNGVGGEGSVEVFTSYLGARYAEGGEGEWHTSDLEPMVDVDRHAEPVGVTEDLLYTLVQSENRPPPVSEQGVIEGRAAIYLRENATGSYRLLLQKQHPGEVSVSFVAAADHDSRIFFESEEPLVGGVEGSRNLYEWHKGNISLVDLLPESRPSDGGLAGSGGGSLISSERALYFVQSAVSEDGSRVDFTDLGTGKLYVREPVVGRTVEVSEGPAAWQASTADGSLVFYTEGGVLYRFDVETGKREPLTGEGADVGGVLGVGGDGAYVYFATTAVLAPGANLGVGNVYVWHEGGISLVTDEGEGDDWTANRLEYGGKIPGGPDEGVRSSRVSSDGRTLMFTSRGSVTGYDNFGAGNDCTEDERSAPCNEVYVYDAVTGRVTCVSCNPSGAPATSDALLYHREDPVFIRPSDIMYPQDLPRNLSADGSRVFFETEEALLPQDTNGAMDVYEWEREGAGSCGSGHGGGCLYLISTGKSSEPSLFAEASASGGDVFFFTRQSLVGQDDDTLVDLYDAREGGGIEAQDAAAPVAPCLGEACRAALSPPPAIGVPVSQVFSGPGNLAPVAEEAETTGKSKSTKKRKSATKLGQAKRGAQGKRKGQKKTKKAGRRRA